MFPMGWLSGTPRDRDTMAAPLSTQMPQATWPSMSNSAPSSCSTWTFPPKPREGDNSWIYTPLLHTKPCGRQQQERASRQVSALTDRQTEEKQRSRRHHHSFSESYPPRSVSSRSGCWLRSIPGPCPRKKLRYFSSPLSVPSSVSGNGCVPSMF